MNVMRTMRVLLFLLAVRGGMACAQDSDAERRARTAPRTHLALRTQRDEMTRNALAFLAESANPDGSFGKSHTRMQTGLAVLAFLSQGRAPGDGEYGEVIARAADWLVKAQAVTGFIGDRDLPTESHAVATLALIEMIGMHNDPALDRKSYRAALSGLEYTLSTQDKAYGGRYNGGWRAETRSKVNDRKVSAWQLDVMRAMEICGTRISRSALLRGVAFMKASWKPRDEKYNRYDIGGFSYDAEGLPVRSISAAGFYCMEVFDEPMSDRRLTAQWFANNPPIWNGPHFFYTQFFAVRALKFHAAADGAAEARERYDDYFREVTDILHNQQRADGSFSLPPGNAEYTKAMGPVYATAMAVLILNCDRNLLPIDMIPESAKPRATAAGASAQEPEK